MFEKSVSQLGFLQFEIIESNIQKNLAQVRAGLTELAPPPGSLIALPEMWATGFAYEDLAELGREIPGLLQELEELAISYQIILAGSLPWQQGEGDDRVFHNTLFFSGTGSVPPHGIAKQYLFSFWKEDRWLQNQAALHPIQNSKLKCMR